MHRRRILMFSALFGYTIFSLACALAPTSPNRRLMQFSKNNSAHLEKPWTRMTRTKLSTPHYVSVIILHAIRETLLLRIPRSTFNLGNFGRLKNRMSKCKFILQDLKFRSAFYAHCKKRRDHRCYKTLHTLEVLVFTRCYVWLWNSNHRKGLLKFARRRYRKFRIIVSEIPVLTITLPTKQIVEQKSHIQSTILATTPIPFLVQPLRSRALVSFRRLRLTML